MLAVAAVFAPPPSAQRRGFGACNFSWDNENYFVSPFFRGNPDYDGRVTFARIKYRGAYECGAEGPGWSRACPRTIWHFAPLLRDTPPSRPFVQTGPIIGSTLVRLDEPSMFKYPVA